MGLWGFLHKRGFVVVFMQDSDADAHGVSVLSVLYHDFMQFSQE